MERRVTKRADGTEMPSLLDGDRKFLKPVHDALATLIKEKKRESVARLELHLSATLVEPVERPLPSADGQGDCDRRFAARFRFAHQEEVPWLGTDLPRDDTALWRLALAARSTASFPVAFEGAVVRSTRAERFGATAVAAPEGRLTDMRDVFSERRGPTTASAALELKDFIVADGGILDNIPLGKAIQAIVDAPADQPTARYLLYVEPVAPRGAAQAVAQRGGAARRSSVAVLGAMFGGRSTSEGISGDMATLETHNAAVERATLLRNVTFAQIGSRQSLLEVAKQQWEGYRSMRADADAALIDDLLRDPREVLGEDPFPAELAGPNGSRVDVCDERWLSPIAAWAPERRQDADRRSGQGVPRADEEDRRTVPGRSVLRGRGAPPQRG